jgi:P-type Cu+ transporter
MKQIELPVGGMDCASCVTHVREALERVEGVRSAEVLLGAAKAIVAYDESVADRVRLAAAVRSAGYSVPSSGGGAVRDADGTDFGRRALAVTGLVFGAVLLVVVAGEWLGLFAVATRAVPLPIGICIVLLIGWPAFRGVVQAARNGRVISHTLMTVGVLAALAIGQWVTAAVVAFFMRVGDHVEGFTLRRGRRALRDLEALAPSRARIERNGEQIDVPLDSVHADDIVVVRPGERVPVDGVVEAGRASVEQSAVTGEWLPVDVAPGSQVYAATIVRGGALRVRVTRVGDEATFGRILRMVEQAEANRGPVQTFADRFSGWYLPIVGAIALLVFVVRRDPLATAAVLVVACSCAFAIATPVAMLASIGAAARRGLLIKGGAYLEALARADVVLVDKTGTFTIGRPHVAAVVALDGVSADDVVRLAASAEHDSEHPIAGSLREEALRRGLALARPVAFEVVEGSGVSAEVDGSRIVVGSERIASAAALGAEVAALKQHGMTLACVTRNGRPIGVIGLRDLIRPDVPAAVRALRELGITRIEILTGDHEAAAAPVAQLLDVPHRAGLLPEDKIRIVREYQQRGHVVVMVGDGVNDAPALAQADVGIAMGAAGTDLALEVAHVALMRDDWSLVPEAIRIARRTMRVVRGNFGFTGVYNIIGISLAAVGILPPIAAAAAQSIPDLGILGNSARLLNGAPRHRSQARTA